MKAAFVAICAGKTLFVDRKGDFLVSLGEEIDDSNWYFCLVDCAALKQQMALFFVCKWQPLLEKMSTAAHSRKYY